MYGRTFVSLFVLPVLFLLLATPVVAQEIDGFWPECGASGDRVLIRGSEFAAEPAVTIGGSSADVIRSRDDAILCLVPAGLPTGAADLTVDADTAADTFLVVADGTPVVDRLSTDTGPTGLPVYVFGRRLHGGTVAFVDASDATQAVASLEGGWRCSVFEVPEDLALGAYTLLFTNADALDTFDRPIPFEVVEAGEATLLSLDPALVPPGRKVICTGTDLMPPGFCRVTWAGPDGGTVERHGLSNGYDTVYTCVPHQAIAGETYGVTVELADGTITNSLTYVIGERGDPELDRIEPSVGPAGSVVTLLGHNLVASGLEPTVAFDDGATSTAAEVRFAMPGFLGHGGMVVAVVPTGLADGAYDVELTLDGVASNALLYTVATLPLSVTRLSPSVHRSDSRHGPRPVAIHGTGFGNEQSLLAIQVVWDDGTHSNEGEVLLRTDRLLIVAVPGDPTTPLPVGGYSVTATLDPDGAPETVSAGTYTVQ